jgi:hypothetical protein
LTSENDSDFLHHGAYANVPAVIAAIGAQLAEPRQEDKDVTAVIDATATPPAPPTATPPALSAATPPAATGVAATQVLASPVSTH